jgi:alkanesulfonate monooxygenase SsuD/methylene tetrahydromethanopterin reductase-like flavin-dependent oxidoreductase (luciferase family)
VTSAIHASVQLPTSSREGREPDAGLVREICAAAEELGFDAVCVGDHIKHPRPMLESVVTLSVAAASTHRVGLEWSMLVVALRQFAVIHKQIATLACFAPGRVSVGIGVGGEFEEEWALCGVPRTDRGARTDQAAALLRAALRGEQVSMPGHAPVRLDPTPLSPPPLFFGGRRHLALKRAAEHGDGWVGWLHSPDGFAATAAALRKLLAKEDASQFWYGMQLPVHIGALPEHPMLSPHLRKYMLSGSPEQVGRRLAQYRDRGATRFKLVLVGEADHGRQLELIASQVMPALRGQKAVNGGAL